MNRKKHAVHITAEIGTAHGGDIDIAKKLIKAAATAGANSVKFQWVYADEILHKNTGMVTLPGGPISLYERFRQLEVKPDFFIQARDYAHECGCGFICSPFGIQSLNQLAGIKPEAIKVASPELNHFPLLDRLVQIRREQALSGKEPVPVILSSGVSKLGDIEKAIALFGDMTQNLTLLHCITAYPAPPEQYNLKLIKNLGAIFGLPIGVSDHSMNPTLVPALSTAYGATFIEKHITLSRKADGLDDPVALEPQDFNAMVRAVRHVEETIGRLGNDTGTATIISKIEAEFGAEIVTKTIGDGIKRLAPAEELNYGRTNRSIHVLHDMKAGETIREKDIAILRTEKILKPGLPPDVLHDIIGTILAKDIAAGQGLTWEEILHAGQTLEIKERMAYT